MSIAHKTAARLYVVIAALSFIATWRQNVAFMSELGVSVPEGFAAFWPALLANRATISITVDIFLFTLAATFWMVFEARRLGIRHVWLYIVFAITVAISVTFPLFLAARERRLAELESSGGRASVPETAVTVGDKLGLALLSVGVVGFAAWCTVR